MESHICKTESYSGASTLIYPFNKATFSLQLQHEGVSKSFWTGHLELELQMVQLFATRCSYIAIL